MKREARKMTVHGRVQGVGFRWYAQRRARSIGICGWVRNCSDGTVEVWAEGSVHELDAFEEALREGPPYSYVKELIVRPAVPANQHFTFEVRY